MDDRLIVIISIHAPAKGATGRFRTSPEMLNISIHAPAKGATDVNFYLRLQYRRFQSTLPRRERPINHGRGSCGKGFQSTLPRRERPCHFNVCRRVVFISIHAPAKGATIVWFSPCSMPVFQSTLPRRERQHLLTSFRLQYGYSLFHLTNKI